MIHHFSIGCWILLFLTPGYTPVFAKGEVIQVPRGLDAALRCRSETTLPPKWEWDSNLTSDNIKTLVVNNTEYLLVENFQEMNEGRYYCINGTGETAVKLEIQLGVKDSAPVYRISRTGSLHLFCEPPTPTRLEGFWSWRQTGSEEDCKRPGSGQTGSKGDCKRSGSGQTGSEEDCKRSGSDLEHFGNRSEVKKNESENKFSLSISPLLWNDSGQYRCTLCDGDKLHKQCIYEIITVKVYSEPMELTEGENGSLVCAISHLKESTRLLWIDTQSQQMFSNPEAQKHAGEFRLVVRNVTLAQSAWECAVFRQDRLRALVPFTLTVKSRATRPPGPPAGGEGARVTDRPGQDPTEASAQNHSGNRIIYLSLVCLCGLLLIILGTVFIIYCCRRHQGDEQTPEADSSTSAALATDNLTPEEDSVIYADVVLATGIRR
ncbi:uncharacterized protein LOC118235224 [Anguilla anguilla]|uniref:uncharacterized protein LOC118235224 n=1 Tax=Anguilla anguilla TaxID=7936 RepID=UPI0015ABEEFC|nr:uncharacterized protein LOC118235224 [Anguilla anguilla]